MISQWLVDVSAMGCATDEVLVEKLVDKHTQTSRIHVFMCVCVWVCVCVCRIVEFLLLQIKWIIKHDIIASPNLIGNKQNH